MVRHEIQFALGEERLQDRRVILSFSCKNSANELFVCEKLKKGVYEWRMRVKNPKRSRTRRV